ncbi:MAG: methyltransferase domain-containing protein [Actinomycetota bacterium]|nr:methyltransferase domain-containing protein [Actinomycetota bacterium]
MTQDDRERLRDTFDTAASRYDRARPDYPDQLIEELITITGIRPGDRLLEVGCGTGKATRALAARGFQITAVELGPDMASVAQQQLSDLPNVEVVHADFETWDPPAGEPFVLVFAATAWHWLDPAKAYLRAAAALGQGGRLAVWSATHVFPEDADPFFDEIQDVYDEIGEGMSAGAPRLRAGSLPTIDLGRASGGRFETIAIRQFDWETVYDSEPYIDLLTTFSGHIAMKDWQRERLFGEIRRRLLARPSGLLRRHWGAALQIGRKQAE